MDTTWLDRCSRSTIKHEEMGPASPLTLIIRVTSHVRVTGGRVSASPSSHLEFHLSRIQSPKALGASGLCPRDWRSCLSLSLLSSSPPIQQALPIRRAVARPPPIQQVPPIRRAIARMRRKARNNYFLGKGTDKRMHGQK